MSLELSSTNPKVVAWVGFDPRIVDLTFEEPTKNCEISIDDFCALILYFMTNNNLMEVDPRLKLLEQLKQLKVVEGYYDRATPDTNRLGYSGKE